SALPLARRRSRSVAELREVTTTQSRRKKGSEDGGEGFLEFALSAAQPIVAGLKSKIGCRNRGKHAKICS
ncbi:MAG: hypothetical protein LBB91_06610, partial [Clostridiales bacterium]|nr:hypothetical protein [Clostridiales bacterium]